MDSKYTGASLLDGVTFSNSVKETFIITKIAVSSKLQETLNERSSVLLLLHQHFHWPLAQNIILRHYLISVQI